MLIKLQKQFVAGMFVLEYMRDVMPTPERTYHRAVLLQLTLKAPSKNCSRRHISFLLLSFEENKACFFHVNPLPSRGVT